MAKKSINNSIAMQSNLSSMQKADVNDSPKMESFSSDEE